MSQQLNKGIPPRDEQATWGNKARTLKGGAETVEDLIQEVTIQ